MLFRSNALLKAGKVLIHWDENHEEDIQDAVAVFDKTPAQSLHDVKEATAEKVREACACKIETSNRLTSLAKQRMSYAIRNLNLDEVLKE